MKNVFLMIAFVAVAALGFGAASLLPSRAPSKTRVPSAAHADAAETADDVAALRAETARLQRLVETQIALAARERSDAAGGRADVAAERDAPGAPDDPELAGPSAPEDEEAREAGEALVNDALDRGEWTSDDAARFRERMTEIGPEGQLALLERIALATNSGALRVTADTRRPF